MSSFEDMKTWDLAVEEIQNLKVMYDVIQFLGLNLKTVWEEMKRKEPDPAQLRKDCMVMALWITTRGTNINETDQKKNKPLRKTKPEGKDLILRLKAKYGLVDGIPGTPATLTLGRVGAVLVKQIATLMIQMNETQARIVGTVPANFPRWLCFPGGASLIPQTHAATLFESWKTWQKSFAKVIDSQTTDDKQEAFANAIFASAMYDLNERIIIFKKLVVMERNKTGGNLTYGVQ